MFVIYYICCIGIGYRTVAPGGYYVTKHAAYLYRSPEIVQIGFPDNFITFSRRSIYLRVIYVLK